MKSRTRTSTTYHPYSNSASIRLSSRSAKSKTSFQNDSIDSDYSTPKTTRTSMTPSSIRNGSKLRNGKFVSHLIYRPLELDNESSTESTDSFRRRDHQSTTRYSPSTPLAIEAPPIPQPPPPRSALSDRVSNVSKMKSPWTPPNAKKQLKLEGGKLTKKEVTPIKRDKGFDIVKKEKGINSDDDCQILLTVPPNHEKTPLNTIPTNMVDTPTQCITPPITPEKSKEDELPQLSVFIPGSCNIEEVLRIYGSNKK